MTMPDAQTMMGFKIWLSGQAYAGEIDAPLDPYSISDEQIWNDYGAKHFEQFATEYTIALAAWENAKRNIRGTA